MIRDFPDYLYWEKHALFIFDIWYNKYMERDNTILVMQLDIIDRTISIIECDNNRDSLKEILHAKKIVRREVSIDGTGYTIALNAEQDGYLPSIINSRGKICGFGDLVICSKNQIGSKMEGLDRSDIEIISEHIRDISIVENDEYITDYSVLEVDSPEDRISLIS